MALKKTVIQPNGVTTTYHRIVTINMFVNQCNSIEVASYINSDGRTREIDFITEQEAGYDTSSAPPYISTRFYEVDYVDGMTVTDAYNKLKELTEFDGAEDV